MEDEGDSISPQELTNTRITPLGLIKQYLEGKYNISIKKTDWFKKKKLFSFWYFALKLFRKYFQEETFYERVLKKLCMEIV